MPKRNDSTKKHNGREYFRAFKLGIRVGDKLVNREYVFMETGLSFERHHVYTGNVLSYNRTPWSRWKRSTTTLRSPCGLADIARVRRMFDKRGFITEAGELYRKAEMEYSQSMSEGPALEVDYLDTRGKIRTKLVKPPDMLSLSEAKKVPPSLDITVLSLVRALDRHAEKILRVRPFERKK